MCASNRLHMKEIVGIKASSQSPVLLSTTSKARDGSVEQERSAIPCKNKRPDSFVLKTPKRHEMLGGMLLLAPEGGTYILIVRQSSQIVSKSRSCRLSAPHTLHLFLESRRPKPKLRRSLGTSKLDLLPVSSPPFSRSAAAFSRAIRSASSASASASGVSGIVSREEMDGLRERIDVGVDGIEDESDEG